MLGYDGREGANNRETSNRTGGAKVTKTKQTRRWAKKEKSAAELLRQDIVFTIQYANPIGPKLAGPEVAAVLREVAEKAEKGAL